MTDRERDRIWEALSKVYNMDGVPDEAKSIIGDVMLKLDESSAQPTQTNTSKALETLDCISRRSAIAKFEPWLKVEGYSEGELNMLKAVLFELTVMPPAISSSRSHENDPISRQAAIAEIRRCRFVVDAIEKISGLPSAQPDTSRIENILHGKSAEEQYDFLHWLMCTYAMQFTDSREAVIAWLGGAEGR